jgi:4-hydroxy-4-methyl-2-oxoglutarate aldolase
VLVVAPTEPCEHGYFGELLATAVRARGVRGLVIEAGCRDVAELERMRFPVWSKHVSPLGTVKEQLGTVNDTLEIAGQVVEPGDVVVADDDGVVIVPRSNAHDVLEACRQREEKEAASRARYAAGEISLDVSNMREELERKGLRYE